jgi:2-hydroxy-3-keto-5-methylthiopentenyl-1-phosphate phosphatase
VFQNEVISFCFDANINQYSYDTFQNILAQYSNISHSRCRDGQKDNA